MRKLDVSLTWNFVSVLGYEVFETTKYFTFLENKISSFSSFRHCLSVCFK